MSQTINVSLSDSLKAFMDARVKARGYGSHSEYLNELVRRDEAEAAKEQFRALVQAGLDSPAGAEWGALKAALKERAQADK